MSELAYTVESYLTAIAISTKKRVLVEGKNDRLHLNNLLGIVAPQHRIHIDAAQFIKSDNKSISRNNRLKVETIHAGASRLGIANVSFLCDREFRNFSVEHVVRDELDTHYNNNKLYWTYGHSMENYFFNNDILTDAYKYLFVGEEKINSFSIFESVLDSAFKLIAAITLASRDINRLTYPLSIITWRDFFIDGATVRLKDKEQVTWGISEDNNRFYDSYSGFFEITSSSLPMVCARISRGHTAMILLQRIFSACIYHASKDIDIKLAEEGANKFSNISEETIATALSESWVRKFDRTKYNYPVSLFDGFSL